NAPCRTSKAAHHRCSRAIRSERTADAARRRRDRPRDWSTNRAASEGADRTVLQRFAAPSPARQEGCKKIAALPPRDLSRKRAGEVQNHVLPQLCKGLHREGVARAARGVRAVRSRTNIRDDSIDPHPARNAPPSPGGRRSFWR